jgi:fucose permease
VLFVVAAGVGQIGFGAANGGVQALFLGLFTEGRGGALNLLHLMFGVGALLGPAAVSIVLATDADWRLVFIASGAICLGLTTAVLTLPQIDLTSTQSPGEPSSTAPILDSERSLSPFIWLAVSIACYEATAIGVASWLVRFLSDESTTVATGALSLFWAGVCAVRLAAPWITRRVAATPLTLACIAGSSLTLAGAVVVPWTPAAVVLFGLTGVGIGPIYPLIIAIGGDLYPRRLAALSGGLTTAATVGAIIYPPLIGFIAGTAGIRAGLLGAAALGIPAALALLAATRPRPGAFPTAGERPNPCGFH